MDFEDNLRRMAIAKVFKDNEAAINGMDYDESGRLLVTSSDDETLRLYNTDTATSGKVLFSKKYGIDLVRFTHSSDAVVCASKNNWDETIRYLSLYDNSYLRYFKGHRDRVLSLSMCPGSDVFISSSLDATVRLWDLRQNGCQGLIHMPRSTVSCHGTPWSLASFDPSGFIFAVVAPHTTANTAEVKLFDASQFERGPFSEATVEGVNEAVSIQFSPDGKRILLLTSGRKLLLLDATPGAAKPLAVLHTFEGFANDYARILEPSFTPDGKYVLCGSEDGSVHVWNTETGSEVCVWKGHAGPVSIVRFNPKFFMAATSCTNLAFWIPGPSITESSSTSSTSTATAETNSGTTGSS